MLNLLGISAATMLALAGAAQAAPAQQESKPNDPNEVICETQKLLGSRIAKKRVCKTRAQWANERLQDRQDIERAQVQRGATAE